MSDLDVNFLESSDGCSLPSDTISRSIRNVYVLLDFGKRLGGLVESWHGSWCQILMKLSQTLLMDVPSHLTPSPDPCHPGLQEETWRTGGVLTWFLMSDLDQSFTDTSDGCSFPSDTISRFIRNVHVLLDSRKGGVLTWRDMEDRKSLDMVTDIRSW